jgi:uncharacterized cupin superfamily protein
MTELAPGWRTARIVDVPPSPRAGDPAFWSEWTDDAEYGHRWHSLAEHFGIRAFGLNANEADAGRELVVRHDETPFGGQEEVYVIVRGRARFSCGGEEVELGPGEVLYARADVTRSAVALEDGTLVLMVGGVPGKPYEPDW